MTSFVASFVLPTGEAGLTLPPDLLAAIAISVNTNTQLAKARIVYDIVRLTAANVSC